MSIVNLYRFDPGAGEAHHGMSRAIAGTTRNANVHALIHDAANFGGGATGNVLAAATSDALGTAVSCDGHTYVVFKIEYSAASTRRFQLMFGDNHGTDLYFPGPFWEPSVVGPANGVTGAATAVSGYFHGQAGIFPVYGFKECKLWLLDGLSTPTVHVWGSAV